MSEKSSSSRPLNIMLVEDNPGDVRLATEALKDSPFDAAHLGVVGEGEQALDFLRGVGQDAESPLPDLIVLDLNLPGKSGLEVLQEVKSDPVLKSIPVVILTSSTAESDILRGYDMQARQC